MRILISANLDVGLYKFRRELIDEIMKRGHEVIISVPDGQLVRPLEEMGCAFVETPVDRRGVNPITDLHLFFRYKSVMKTVNPDMIITYTIKPNIYCGIAARLSKKQYVANITGLGTAFEKRGAVRILVEKLYKIALKRAKIIFFENTGDRDKMVSLGCCDKKKTVVLSGAGVNTEHYSYRPYPDNEKVRFLFVGRIMKEKGIEELFEAMKRLIREGINCSLDVVGPLEENYEDKLAQFEAEGWLKYYGFQEDVRPFMKACDCFILPSYHEGMANTNLELASSGRPIITSDIPGCREAVIKDKSGYLCKPNDTESLYKAMKKMVELGKNERAQMGAIGRKHMENIFDKRKIVAQTLENLL